MSISRRAFCAALLAAPIVVKAMGIESLVDSITPGMVSHSIGYNKEEDFTWLRTTVLLPDGREFHDLSQKTGNCLADPAMLFMCSEEARRRYMEKFTG